MADEGPPLDADRLLALSYVPGARREALGALWRLDASLGSVLAGGREPLLSQIKLTWWRESLERLDHASPPAEPILEALARYVLPFGVTGAALAMMEEGWSVLLSQEPLSEADLTRYSAARGTLFQHSAVILGGDLSGAMERLGEGWALVDLARHSNAVDAASAFALARDRLEEAGGVRWPARLRPIGMLAALAIRDAAAAPGALEPHGSPRRMLRMLAHRLTGR